MARFYGTVGYATRKEVRPGVWDDETTERKYYGEVLRYIRKSQPADKSTDDIGIDMQISIVSDPFAIEHFHSMRYVEFMGARWEISSIEPRHPRLILTLGGLYNG